MRKLTALLLLTLLLVFLGGGTAIQAADEPLTLLNKPAQQNTSPQAAAAAGTDTDSLRDIYGPVNISNPFPYFLLAAAAILSLLAAILFWIVKKRPKSAAPPLPPWELALRDLTDARSLLTPEKGLAYMDRASNILRRYIESRFSIKSTRQTTREFLTGLQSVTQESPLKTYKSELQGCLEQADMAKFAHRKPDLQNLESMEEAVSTFIRRTGAANVPGEEKS
ncbi:MAG: DUF4381 family protein [Desulforhopalus sp.]